LANPHSEVLNGQTIEYFDCPDCHGKDLEKKNLGIDTIPIDTLNFEGMSKWSDTIMNPILQASNKELKVQEAMMDIQKPKINLLITFVGIGIMLFLLLLGVSILLPHVTQSAAPVIPNVAGSIINATNGGLSI
jgi:hypothetical protein